MPKNAAMAPMIAWSMLAMPLMTAMMQFPIVRKSAVIYVCQLRSKEPQHLSRETYARDDGTHFECWCKRVGGVVLVCRFVS